MADGAAPELGAVVLEVLDSSTGTTVRLDTWKSYRFNSNFLSKTDGWSCTLGDESISDKLIASVKVGMKIQLRIDNLVQGSGYIDDVEISSSRSGGTEVSISGRDVLAPTVDACMDPTIKLTAGQTVVDLLQAVFNPFGLLIYVADNDDNRGLMTGQTRGTPTSKKGKPLKSYVLHQLKPYPNEGAFDFASRVCQRHGLWIWPSSTGTALIVGRPSYDVGPDFYITHKRGDIGATNNVIHSTVRRSSEQQPSVIVATGFGAGGENAISNLRVIMVNELVAFDATGALQPSVAAILAKYPSAYRFPTRLNFTPPAPLKPSSDSAFFTTNTLMIDPVSRPMFLHDDESKDLDKLKNFTQREMALRQRRALDANYTVEGHKNNGMPWSVDCVVDVQDDISGLYEKMWILGRTFVKDRNGGTMTELELIRQHTLDFFPPS